MLAFVMIAGAIVVFVAGWTAARVTSREDVIDAAPMPTPPRPVGVEVLDDHDVGVIVSSASGVVEYRNAAAVTLGGTHVGVLIDGAIERHLAAARHGAPSEETLDLFGPPRRVVQVSARPLADGRAVAFVSDVTERRRLDQVRTDFVANVSHELRTPVGALTVLADTLAESDDPAVVERVVPRMQREAERATRTIDDLLELSRIESAVATEFQPVWIADVVREAVGRVAELASRNEIRISTLDPVDDGGPRSEQIAVDGDRRYLASAIGNLVENAVKFSDRGGTVQVRVATEDGFAVISIVDGGAGIPRHDLDRVFERFYRVDRARSRTTGGTGLGLSIVRHVAQLHGGTVSVESVEGEGSTFTFRVPLAATPTSTDENERGAGVA